jgi:hypothetical protein
VTAENALVADDVCLVSGKPNGFDRTVPDALIAVLAVGFFECKTVWQVFFSHHDVFLGDPF